MVVPPKGNGAAALHVPDRDVEALGGVADGAPFGAVLRGAGPQFARMEIAQYGAHAAHVVLMGVRHDDDVEMLDGARPEVGRDDVFADIEARFARAAEGRDSAGIDQHQRPLREADEQAVALADIDRAEFELAVFDYGREGMDHDEGERGGDGGPSGDDAPAAI